MNALDGAFIGFIVGIFTMAAVFLFQKEDDKGLAWKVDEAYQVKCKECEFGTMYRFYVREEK